MDRILYNSGLSPNSSTADRSKVVISSFVHMFLTKCCFVIYLTHFRQNKLSPQFIYGKIQISMFGMSSYVIEISILLNK